MKPTEEQRDIRDASRDLQEGDALKIHAFAGAGKTSTLKIVAEANARRGIYLAFNKAIAEEARTKLALTRCSANTMHSLAFSVFRDVMRSPASHSAKSVRESGVMGRFSIPKVSGWHDFRIASAVCRTMASFANSADQEFRIEHAEEAIISSVGDPEFLKSPEKKEQAQEAISALALPVKAIAEAFWLKCYEQGELSHDMYLKALDLDPNSRSKAFSSFRYLMVDEAQDINPVQRSILTKTGLPLIAVGDPYQQIYSWRGAENALELLPGKDLYLTQSFRFGENIAEAARHILATRPDGGPRQRLVGVGGHGAAGHKGPSVAIVCRTNMGVLEEALRVMRKGIPLQVDNIEGLLVDVTSAQALYEGRPDLVKSQDIRPFADWSELKMEAEEGDQVLGKIVNLVETDMVPQVIALADHQRAGHRDAKVAICTAHRSKGLEWPAVQLGGDWKSIDSLTRRHRASCRKSEKHVTQAIEEWNALYVAATRPMVRLSGERPILFPEPVFDEDTGMGRDVDREMRVGP